MQNNVTELTQKLLRALDTNYNVIDMPTVIEVVSLLEKVTITKELLEATRLGRHVNELRRNTTNESLAKRAKELVKKWRSLVLPDSNGQLKPTDSQLTDEKSKKRTPKDKLDNVNLKKPRLNGTNEYDFSDNSNSSFKDAISATKIDQQQHHQQHQQQHRGKDVILINSDSNSSFPDGKNDPVLEQQQPKKRGRKKGSKNHRNLLDEAETSFSNKMAVSRGNAKVKTTQELIASLQNKSTSLGVVSPAKSKEDLMEKAAKLTERVSIIDQKLNTSGNRYKNAQKRNSSLRNRVIESGVVTNVERSPGEDNKSHTDDEIIVVDEESEVNSQFVPAEKTERPQSQLQDEKTPKSLSVEDALALLPPVDKSCLYEADPEDVECSCALHEYKTDFSVVDDEDAEEEGEEVVVPPSDHHRFEFKEDCDCRARAYLRDKYHLDGVSDERVHKLHECFVPGLNGNWSAGRASGGPDMLRDRHLYANVVPNRNSESIPKCCGDFACENFKKYSISEEDRDDGVSGECERTSGVDAVVVASERGTFKEWHEVVERPSYNGEIFKILPYVIID